MKRAAHDGHATVGVMQNYNRSSSSPLLFYNWILHVVFHMCHKECHEIMPVDHSWLVDVYLKQIYAICTFIYS